MYGSAHGPCCEQLISFLCRRGVSHDNVCFVGGDGTNSVVGWRGGMMAELEQLLGRPLSRVVCLNHHAELPYRSLFRALDGQTTGPFSFSGPIGKLIDGAVHQLPVVQFEPLTGTELPQLPAETERGLSSDLRLLVQCARCVVSGDGGPVQHRRHGRLNMARWHTAQSRLLRVYMSQTHPSGELVALAVYITAVYVPTVMAIRYRPDLVEAPRHLFDELQRQRRHLSGANLATVQESVARNAMMAHPENVVLAMLGDERRAVRADAVKLTQQARRRRRPGQVRQFRCPIINVSANDYTELADLQRYANEGDIEPPCTRRLTDDELTTLLDRPYRTHIPCHTQSTERAVKLTTESAAAV